MPEKWSLIRALSLNVSGWFLSSEILVSLLKARFTDADKEDFEVRHVHDQYTFRQDSNFVTLKLFAKSSSAATGRLPCTRARRRLRVTSWIE